MQTFVEHYYLQEKFKVGRALSNILKKRTEGIDLGKGKYKIVVPVGRQLYNRYIDDLRREAVSAYRIKRKEPGKKIESTKKRLKQNLGKLYVSDAYEGEIDSGSELIEGNPVSSMVYKLSNGARIAFITTESKEGVRHYIATSSKGNDFFRENLGITVQQIHADSKAAKDLISTPKGGLYKSSKLLSKDIEDEEGSNQEQIEPEINSEGIFGVMDISREDFDAVKKIWGNGKKGGYNKGGEYLFKDKFTRKDYYNADTGYSGYKYSSNNGKVYLMDTGDDKNYFIAFANKPSYEWAKNIGMLAELPYASKRLSVHWQEGNVENNL